MPSASGGEWAKLRANDNKRRRKAPKAFAAQERAIIRSDLIRLGLLWLCGACLRLTVLAIPPVVPLLHADLHLSETAIGWLSSLPPMLFAIAAIPGALLIARFGILPALIIGLLINAFGSAARAAYPDAISLYMSTIVMAAGVSIMQPSLPPLVRAWFPHRVGFATAVYTNGLLLGETLTVALTIPLVLPLVHNSWRASFVVWSMPVLLTAVLVMICIGALGGTQQTAVSTNRRWWPDWRQPLIWRLGTILGSINAMYFVANAFLPDYVTAMGRADLIGPALTALNFCQVPASVIMLGLAGRLLKEPWAYRISGGLAVLCIVGMITMNGYWIVFWCGVFGFVVAVTLVLVLALPSVLGAPDDVHRTSAGMFTISYSVAMVLSVLGGWLWDLTHLPVAGLAPAVVCGLVVVLLSSTVRHTYRPTTA
ncbi:MAG TPA: MFS transporter [Xanthobacteraceae bacterium]|nr:MFS transporter [Xanthobacteraceae bacterium]